MHPLGLFRRTSTPCIWCILSGFPTLLTPLAEGTSFSQARSSRATCSSAPTDRPPACARARRPRRRAGRAGCGSRGTLPGAGCSQPRAVLPLRADIHLNLLNNSCNSTIQHNSGDGHLMIDSPSARYSRAPPAPPPPSTACGRRTATSGTACTSSPATGPA